MVLKDKRLMSEEDIKLNYITPALQKHWKDMFSMEARITDGKICLKGNMSVREAALKADYLLELGPNRPIAVVEAKKIFMMFPMGSSKP